MVVASSSLLEELAFVVEDNMMLDIQFDSFVADIVVDKKTVALEVGKFVVVRPVL